MLYHVSPIIVEKFELRVPKYKLAQEDDKTKRICFASSIENALSAIRGEDLLYAITKLEKANIPAILQIYSVDETKLREGIDFISNKTIIKKNLVPDAKYTGECWIINEKIPLKHTAIEVEDYKTSIQLVNIKGKKFVFNKISELKFRQIEDKESDILYKNNISFWNDLKKMFLQNGLTFNANIIYNCANDDELMSSLYHFATNIRK